jgi:hypothetical protein
MAGATNAASAIKEKRIFHIVVPFSIQIRSTWQLVLYCIMARYSFQEKHDLWSTWLAGLDPNESIHFSLCFLSVLVRTTLESSGCCSNNICSSFWLGSWTPAKKKTIIIPRCAYAKSIVVCQGVFYQMPTDVRAALEEVVCKKGGKGCSRWLMKLQRAHIETWY